MIDFLDKIIMNGTRNYKVIESKPSSIDVISTLRLKRARKKDLGKYECVVKNSLGENTKAIRLYRKFIVVLYL